MVGLEVKKLFSGWMQMGGFCLGQIWNQQFFCQLKKIRKNLANKSAYIATKLYSGQDCLNKYLTQMQYFSFFWQVLQDISIIFTKYSHVLHHLQTMKVTFQRYF